MVETRIHQAQRKINMDEVENNVMEEVVPQETSHEDSQPQQKVVSPVDDTQERNWKALREKARRADELEQRLRLQEEMMAKIMHSSPKQIIEEPEEPDEDFIPKGKVKRVARKEVEPIEQRLKQAEEQIARQNHSLMMADLKRKYADFDEVVNTDSLALLEENDPELASAIIASNDPLKIAVQSYKYIKAMNINSKVPDSRRVKEVEKKLEQNAKTVQTPQAYDKRPMAQAYKITEEEKKSLYKEMMEYAGQVGFSY
jgi:hypothetical protein